MSPSIHTPLESFLLLRELYPYDGDPYIPSFERASISLKDNSILQRNGAFDISRFSPTILQELYLALLKEQAKLDTASRNVSPSKGGNPRKRKLSSPKVETLDDASHYAHLLPKLISRLYGEYKDDAIRSIEEEERQFRSLQDEIRALELYADEAKTSRPGSQGVPPISALLRETEDSAQPPRAAETVVKNNSHDGILPPQGNLHADIYRPLSQPRSAENGPPYLPPPPAPPSHSYSLPSVNVDKRNATPNQAAASSPHPPQAALPGDRSSASPIILPPPKGMVHASGSPPVHSPQQPHYPPPRQHPAQHPTRHPQPSYYYDSHGYPMSYPYGQSPPSLYHPQGNNRQSYHASPQSSHAAPYPAQAYQSPVASQHPYYQHPNQYAPTSTAHTPFAQTGAQPFDTRTPYQAPSSQKPPKPSPIVTSTLSTKWKKFDLADNKQPPSSPTRPTSRDISPISEPESAPEVTPLKKGGRANQLIEEERTGAREQPTRGRGRGGRVRGSGRGRRGRVGSIGSSTIAESRRSPSVTDEPSAVKAERSHARDDSVSAASLTADESHKPNRRRRGSTRNAEAEPARSKRKRDPETPASFSQQLASTLNSPQPPTPGPHRPAERPGFILATRNFQRLTHQLMSEITSHRLASLFAKPLNDRDAPGYKDLILRPQDLKSIRGAISAGGRALTALLEEAGEAARPGAHIWVREDRALMPPKGIVNASQLEKELMRIFANAVMFNSDVAENRGLGPAFRTRAKQWQGSGLAEQSPDGQGSGVEAKFEIGVALPTEGDIVKETREVATDAQESFAKWKAVESERDGDIADLAGDIGDEKDAKGGGDAENQGSVEAEEGERKSKRRRR